MRSQRDRVGVGSRLGRPEWPTGGLFDDGRHIADETRPLGEPGHGRRVGRLAAHVAARLGGADPTSAYRAGMLHDVGKAMLPVDPTRLPRPLTPGERAVVQMHPLLGAQLLLQGGADEMVVTAALLHHERIDGSGYPFGLGGDEVPMVAQIVGAVDLYDALRSARSYKAAWSRADVLRYGASQRGRWFLPEVWDALVATTEPSPHVIASISERPRRTQAVTTSPPAGPMTVQSPENEPRTNASSEPSVAKARQRMVRYPRSHSAPPNRMGITAACPDDWPA